MKVNAAKSSVFFRNRALLFLPGFVLCFFYSSAAEFNIIPKPVSIKAANGSFVFNEKTEIISEPGNNRMYSNYLNDHIYRIFGFRLNCVEDKSNGPAIHLLPVSAEHSFGKYELRINEKEINVYGNPEGCFYGINSLVQLLYQFKSGSEAKIPGVTINDEPKYQWRGMHLDVCRHFFPKEFILKYIDLLAFYKMNIFHWHLTEDQGWRIEIKKFPNLTKVGAWRKGSMIGHYNEQRFDTLTYGGYYSQKDIKEIVAHAESRHVTIVPEIELPGHSLAALAAYPQFSCTGGPFKVAKGWGVFEDVYCAGNDSTFLFLEGVLDEVCELFPGKYIHIGGDECPKERWKKCSKCQARIKSEGLKDEHELQSYFIRRIEKHINAKGKQIIGWDEILEGGLAPNAAVMSWRGTDGGIAAAKQKHNVIMTPGSHCYFDHYQGDPRNEPVAIGGYTTVQKVYSYNPRPEGLSDDEAKFILGAQGNVWTEYINTPQQVEYMAVPRMIALAEVLWTPEEQKNENDFIQRLLQHFSILSKEKVNYAESLFRITISTGASSSGLKVVLSGLDIGKIMYENPGFSGHRKLSSGLKEYNGPFEISNSCMVRSFLVLPGDLYKLHSELRIWVTKSAGKKVQFTNPPSSHYPGKGGFTLVDGIRAVVPRINSEWLAWSGDDMETVIDLGTEDTIQTVSVGYLEDVTNWIYAPNEISIMISPDGKKYKQVHKLTREEIVRVPRDATSNFKPVNARFVKIKATNPGIIAAGKPGAGQKSWIFFDEILIN